MKIRNLLLILIVSTLFFGLLIFQKYYLLNQVVKRVNLPVLVNNDEFVIDQVIYAPFEEPLKNPIDLAVNASGNIYVADSDNHRIQVFDEDGDFLFRFGELGDQPGQLNYPVGIAIDSKSNVYVADLLNQRISVFNKSGRFQRFLELKTKDAAPFIPTAIEVDKDDFVYIIDKADQKLKKISQDGKVVKSFGGFGHTEGKFQYPLGFTIGPKGNIYVSDTGNGRIQVFDKDGNYKYQVTGNLRTPSGIRVDGEEQMYISDPTNGQITVTTYWGEGEGSIGNKGVQRNRLYFPEGLELVDDHLYVADKGNNRIAVYKITKHK